MISINIIQVNNKDKELPYTIGRPISFFERKHFLNKRHASSILVVSASNPF